MENVICIFLLLNGEEKKSQMRSISGNMTDKYNMFQLYAVP